jgi:hypothetical protein
MLHLAQLKCDEYQQTLVNPSAAMTIQLYHQIANVIAENRDLKVDLNKFFVI